GLRIFLVSLGRGPVLYTTCLRGVRIELKLWLIGGFVRSGDPNPVGFRRRFFQMTLAGPLVNAVCLLWALEGTRSLTYSFNLSAMPNWSWLQVFALVNGLILVVNLFPQPASTDEEFPSDGFQLCHVWFLTPAEIEYLCVSYYLLEAQECAASRD